MPPKHVKALKTVGLPTAAATASTAAPTATSYLRFSIPATVSPQRSQLQKTKAKLNDRIRQKNIHEIRFYKGRYKYLVGQIDSQILKEVLATHDRNVFKLFYPEILRELGGCSLEKVNELLKQNDIHTLNILLLADYNYQSDPQRLIFCLQICQQHFQTKDQKHAENNLFIELLKALLPTIIGTIVYYGHIQIFRYLPAEVLNQALLLTAQYSSEFALHCFEILISCGANIKATDEKGRTSLQLAVKYKSLDIVDWLTKKSSATDDAKKVTATGPVTATGSNTKQPSSSTATALTSLQNWQTTEKPIKVLINIATCYSYSLEPYNLNQIEIEIEIYPNSMTYYDLIKAAIQLYIYYGACIEGDDRYTEFPAENFTREPKPDDLLKDLLPAYFFHGEIKILFCWIKVELFTLKDTRCDQKLDNENDRKSAISRYKERMTKEPDVDKTQPTSSIALTITKKSAIDKFRVTTKFFNEVDVVQHVTGKKRDPQVPVDTRAHTFASGFQLDQKSIFFVDPTKTVGLMTTALQQAMEKLRLTLHTDTIKEKRTELCACFCFNTGNEILLFSMQLGNSRAFAVQANARIMLDLNPDSDHSGYFGAAKNDSKKTAADTAQQVAPQIDITSVSLKDAAHFEIWIASNCFFKPELGVTLDEIAERFYAGESDHLCLWLSRRLRIEQDLYCDLAFAKTAAISKLKPFQGLCLGVAAGGGELGHELAYPAALHTPDFIAEAFNNMHVLQNTIANSAPLKHQTTVRSIRAIDPIAKPAIPLPILPPKPATSAAAPNPTSQHNANATAELNRPPIAAFDGTAVPPTPQHPRKKDTQPDADDTRCCIA